MKLSLEKSLIQSPQILLVDDEPAQLSQLYDYLSSRACWVFQTRNAEQAQKVLQRYPVDVVITDWIMPGISGLELIRCLRETGFKGPLLVCTGLMLEPEHLQQAFAAGASDYLRKPLNAVELLARLENSLQLYAHRAALHHFSQSQGKFISYLSQKLGSGLERINQLQSPEVPDKLQQRLLPEPIAELNHHFTKLMLWARYRFALEDVQLSRFELRQVFKSLELGFSAQAHRLKLRGGRDLYLNSDLDMLQRILWQLVDNALRYTRGPVTLNASQLSQGLRLEVLDEGGSLSEGQLVRLRSDQHGGLGLQICYDLLAMLDSRLQGRQRRSGGSSFFFELHGR